MALNVTGSTICKPVSFRRGENNPDVSSNADLKPAIEPQITEHTASNNESRDRKKDSRISDVNAEISIDDETIHQTTERNREAIETERDQQVIDQVTTALISARNAGARELAEILDESITGDAKPNQRNETQVSQERRTIRVTGNENFSSRGDPASTVSKSPNEENLNLALVPVEEGVGS